MKNLFIITGILLLLGCESLSEPPVVDEFSTLGESLRNFEYEGCQYIVVGSGSIRMMSHKGNCSNPIHKCKCQ